MHQENVFKNKHAWIIDVIHALLFVMRIPNYLMENVFLTYKY